MIPSLEEAPREVRRQVFAQERKERASGKWSPWETLETPRGMPGSGWVRDIRRVYRNGWCAVLQRPFMRNEMAMDHLAIRTALHAEPTWKELQRIKDELMGPERTAIQVYPRAADLIDDADMYHLWVFPAGFRFHFGLAEGQT